MKSFQIRDLTIPVPIVQRGMGIDIFLSGLAFMYTKACGTGTIETVSVGLIHGISDKSFRQNIIDGVIGKIHKARQQTQGLLDVNIMCVLSNYSELVEVSNKEKTDIIFSGSGLTQDIPKYKTPGYNTKLIPIVSSARAARIILQKWLLIYKYFPDAFVVECPKITDHLGFSLNDLKFEKFNIKTQVIEIFKITWELKSLYKRIISVIAGFSIKSGHQIRGITSMGVSAVQLGSSFIATREYEASSQFKQVFIDSNTENIRLVSLPVRAIEIDFFLAIERYEKRPINYKYNYINHMTRKRRMTTLLMI